MKPKENMTPEEQETLVSFLDGELDEKTTKAVEARMNKNPASRCEADALQRAWDLLDYLPRPEPAESFSQQTIARFEVEKSRSMIRLQRRRWLGWVGWGLGAAAAGVLGFLVIYQPPPTAEELRVVEHQELYRHVDDWEFLQELASADLFGEDL